MSKRAKFQFESSTMEAYNRMYDIGLSSETLAALAPALEGAFTNAEDLWAYDLEGVDVPTDYSFAAAGGQS